MDYFLKLGYKKYTNIIRRGSRDRVSSSRHISIYKWRSKFNFKHDYINNH